MSLNTQYGLRNQYEVNRDEYEPRGLIIDLLRQCTETCRHCVVGASPSRRERLNLEQVEMALQDAEKNNFVSASFYGGEPFTAKELLYDAVGLTYRHGLQPQIMSNGFWGRTVERAHKTFDQLTKTQPPNCTVPISINLSTDEFHDKVSLQCFANILTAWASRNEKIDINIGIGEIDSEGEYVNTTLDEILDLFDKQNESSGLKSCFYQDMLSDEMCIRFIDKFIIIPRDGELQNLLRELRENEMLSPEYIGALEENARDRENAFRLIDRNRWLKIAQNKEERERKVCRIGRMKADKIVQFRSYSINLFGAGRALQADENMRQKAASTRDSHDREANIHEFESILMLGSDNRFYIAPIQLQHQVKPLGENTGDSIHEVIQTVNSDEPVSNIIMKQNISRAKMLVLASGDHTSYNQMMKLEAEGLIHEAIEVFLMSEATMRTLS